MKSRRFQVLSHRQWSAFSQTSPGALDAFKKNASDDLCWQQRAAKSSKEKHDLKLILSETLKPTNNIYDIYRLYIHYIIYYILYIIYYILYIIYYILYIIYYRLYIIYYILYIIYYILYIIYYILCIVYYILYIIGYMLYVLCYMLCVLCYMLCVVCYMFFVICYMLYIVYCIFYMIYCILWIIYYILYIIYNRNTTSIFDHCRVAPNPGTRNLSEKSVPKICLDPRGLG